MLKKIFPFSFIAENVKGLVIAIVGYILAGAVISFLFSWLAGLWLIGWVFHIIMSVIDLYFFVGIVIAVLVYLKIVS